MTQKTGPTEIPEWYSAEPEIIAGVTGRSEASYFCVIDASRPVESLLAARTSLTPYYGFIECDVCFCSKDFILYKLLIVF
jgi:hypothetical protein